MQEEPRVLATLPGHRHKDDKTRTHVLRVDGLVGQCLELTLADLEGLPQQDLTDDFTCLEGWTVPNLKWRGVPLETVLSLAQPSPEAHYVQASAGDFSVPLTRDHAERALLAIRLGEHAVPPEHGGPVRLIVPGGQCFTSIKWLDRLATCAERLRRFIAAYAEKTRSWSAEKQPKYKAWIKWATRQADRIDPFVSEKPASVLDRKRELGYW